MLYRTEMVKIFDQCAKLIMTDWDLEAFERDYPTLMSAIEHAMVSYALKSVRIERGLEDA